MGRNLTAYDTMHRYTIGELISIQATRYGTRPFLQLGDQQWTYAEVENQSSSMAAGLHKLGLKSGDRLAVILPNCPEFVITLFASAKAGLTLVPINIRRHPQEILARLSHTRPAALITFSDPASFNDVDHLAVLMDMRPNLPGLSHLIALKPPSAAIKDGVIAWDYLQMPTAPIPPLSARPDDPAAIVHTLGSSGEPHGAILSHVNLIRTAAEIASALECTPDDIFLGSLPFSNIFGLSPTILACAESGARLICLPRYNPAEALRLIKENAVTVHHGVPSMFALELNHPSFDPVGCKTLRTGVMSGAPCPSELVRRVREEMGYPVVLGYGLTEASPAVTMTRPDDGPVTSTETVGRPLDGIEIKIIDASGKTLPAGEEGELCVRGFNVMLGYWDDPEATAKAIDAEGWLHTGDLAIIDIDGPVKIVGRKDEVINRGGFKIYPGTAEMVLCSFPGVRDAAVVGIPDLIYGELMVACVVKQPGADFSEDDLLEFASSRLASYAKIDRLLFFEALPHRGGGPVQKEYLRERVRIRGHAWKFGKNIDTDAIIPARRCNTADPRELALYCMEDADPKFVQKMRRGDLIIADTNFGCGSSREVAPLTIKASGVSAVIAKSFARIFFRNAINIGLPILECPQAVDGIQQGDDIEVEPASGTIRNLSNGEVYNAEPYPPFLQRIIDRGGLLAYVEERLAQES